MKLLLPLALLLGCDKTRPPEPTDLDATIEIDTPSASTTPTATTFSCAVTGAHVVCDLGFTDADRDFKTVRAIAWELLDQIPVIYQWDFPELAGLAAGTAHFEFDLPKPATTDVTIKANLYDSAGHTSLVEHPVIDL